MNRFKRTIAPLASLRLTVFILSAALILVFAGTLAQVKFGLYLVQEEYFQSWLIWWSSADMDFSIPVYPGGHLIGAALMLNLLAAYIVRFRLSWRKAGIQLIHAGLIIMLAGGLATDLLSVWSFMRIEEGQTRNYSEDEMRVELAVADVSDPNQEVVTAIPGEQLEQGEVIDHPSLPFQLKVLHSYRNSRLKMGGSNDGLAPASTQGIGARIAIKPMAPATKTDERNVMSAVLEVLPRQGSSEGSWLVSDSLSSAQQLESGGKTWSLQMRPARYYKPFSMTLLDFTHETYPGTSIPKDFSSTILLNDEANDVQRKVRIFMNHPLRYGGETYYQSGYSPDNLATVLRVVRNPGYQAPYIACVIMSVGLIYQFTYHLVAFTRRRKTLPTS